jgi:hypothetical protein
MEIIINGSSTLEERFARIGSRMLNRKTKSGKVRF